MHASRSLLKSVLLLFLAATIVPAPPILAAGQRVAVLVGSEQAPFLMAVDGLEKHLTGQVGNVEVIQTRLPADATQRTQMVKKMADEGPDLVIALGSLALDEASRQIKNTPIVAGMVMDLRQRESNVTGVELDIPFDVQLEWIKRFLPDTASVGIIYNQRENGAKAEELKRLAHGKGLKIESKAIASPTELVPALESFGNKIDVLLGINDTVVLTSQTAQKILLFSFRNRIPFIGPSEAWAKAGAFYALDRDYRDVGIQCGELAVRILNGAKVVALPPASPRKVLYSVNMKSAEQMKLSPAAALLKGATTVY